MSYIPANPNLTFFVPVLLRIVDVLYRMHTSSGTSYLVYIMVLLFLPSSIAWVVLGGYTRTPPPPQKAKQEKVDKVSKMNFYVLCGKNMPRTVMIAQMLEASVSFRSENDAPSRKGCVVNDGQMTNNAGNKWVRPPHPRLFRSFSPKEGDEMCWKKHSSCTVLLQNAVLFVIMNSMIALIV